MPASATLVVVLALPPLPEITARIFTPL